MCWCALNFDHLFFGINFTNLDLIEDAIIENDFRKNSLERVNRIMCVVRKFILFNYSDLQIL